MFWQLLKIVAYDSTPLYSSLSSPFWLSWLNLSSRSAFELNNCIIRVEVLLFSFTFAVVLSSCAASLLNSGGSCQAGRKLFLLPRIFRRHWRILSVTGALCAVPFLQKPENLSHEDLVRRASSLVTDSANTFLSQTTLALIDSFTGYIKAVNVLVALHKQYEASISKFTPEEENAIWKVILAQRQEVIGRKKDCKHFESCWMTAINLSQQAAEAAFNAGADQASVAAQSSLQVAQSQVEQVRQLMLEAEMQLKDSKAEDSERLQVALSEDEDIPDAYLRED